jgi:hypothetical protein
VKIVAGLSIVRAALGQVLNFSKLLLLNPLSEDKLRLCLELGSMDQVGHFQGKAAYYLGLVVHHENQCGAGWEGLE